MYLCFWKGSIALFISLKSFLSFCKRNSVKPKKYRPKKNPKKYTRTAPAFTVNGCKSHEECVAFIIMIWMLVKTQISSTTMDKE